MTIAGQTALLRRLFHAAIAAAQPAVCLPPFLPPPPRSGRAVVVGAGKAAAAMAQTLEQHWPDKRPLSGVVAAKADIKKAGGAWRRIRILESAHPIPDSRSVVAAKMMMEAVRGLSARDLVIALISGGGSSLAALPAAGVTLADKQAATRRLLAGGAAIDEINIVRAALSQIKNGGLARAAYPAKIITLAISDVAGDSPAIIASAPTIAKPQSVAAALDIARKYRLPLSAAMRAAIKRAAADDNKPMQIRGEYHLIASPMQSLRAAAVIAKAAGFTPLILSDRIEGESCEAAKTQAAIALSAVQHGTPIPPPLVLLSGGETTVTLPTDAYHPNRSSSRVQNAAAKGKSGISGGGQNGGKRRKGENGERRENSGGVTGGGRNTEFALSFALALADAPRAHRKRIAMLAADTDGEDGNAIAANGIPIAGAIVHHKTLIRAAAVLDPTAALANHNAAAVFAAADGLLLSGVTMTNVNDFRAVLVD